MKTHEVWNLASASTTDFNLDPQAEPDGGRQTASQLNIMAIYNYKFKLRGIEMNDIDTNINDNNFVDSNWSMERIDSSP